MSPFCFALESFVISSTGILTRLLTIGLLMCEDMLQFFQRMLFPSAQLEYRTVAISMASCEMGKALAYEYASQGQRLVLLCDHQINLEKVARRCRTLGSPSVTTGLLNICNANAVTEFFDSKVDNLNVDLFIANAFLRAFDVPQLNGPNVMGISINYFNAVEGISAVFEASKRLCRPFQIAGVNLDGVARIQPYTVDLMIQFDISKSALMTFGSHLRELGKEFDIHVSTTIAEEYLLTSLLHAAGWSACAEMISRRSASRIRRALAQDIDVVYPPADIYFYSTMLASLPTSMRQVIAFILE